MGGIVTKELMYKGLNFKYSYLEDDPSGEGCIAEIIRCDTYDLSRFVNRKNATFLDIGANYGLVTIILAIQNPESKVYTFEPNAQLFGVLTRNIEQNNLKNVILTKAALNHEDEDVNLYIANSCSGASSTNVTDESAFWHIEGDGTSIQVVKGMRFDTIITTHSIECIDFLKIDCEGAEYYLYDSFHFKKGIVGSLGGEFHQTAYGESSQDAADKLFEFCKKFVKGSMEVTVLDRFFKANKYRKERTLRK